MLTNLAIDDRLLAEAQTVGGHRTKKDAANEALEEYVQRRRQAKITELFGTIELEPAYDYEKQRRRSRTFWSTHRSGRCRFVDPSA